MVKGTGPLGCVPAELASSGGANGECAPEAQQAAAIFNPALIQMLQRLNSEIGSNVFIGANAFNMNADFINNPQRFDGVSIEIRGEDDIVELLRKSGQVVRSSQTQGPSSDASLILRGSGSGSGGDGEGSVQQHHHENLFIQEDEMVSWLHQPLHRDDIFYSGVSTSVTHMQSSQSLAPPLPSAPYGQTMVSRRPENFSNFSMLRCNILSGARLEAAPSMQLGSSVTPLSTVTESFVIPTTKSTESRVSRTFSVPGLGRKEIETIGEETPSSGVCKAETEQIPLQSTVETQITVDRKRKEREETNSDNKETEETRGTTSRKRSRTTEMHNVSERRRREKINEKMKTLQELIPRCNKADRASILDDAIEYMKSLQMQVQMMSMGQGMMPPSMMYGGHMQQLMPHMAMGMMGMSRPPFLPFPGTTLPRPAPMPSLFPSYPAQPYPFTNVQASDPSRVHLPTPQPNPTSDQPQFPAYMNPYCQFVGLHQIQPPPPPLQSQRTSQLRFTQASGSKELEDQDKQPGG